MGIIFKASPPTFQISQKESPLNVTGRALSATCLQSEVEIFTLQHYGVGQQGTSLLPFLEIIFFIFYMPTIFDFSDLSIKLNMATNTNINTECVGSGLEINQYIKNVGTLHSH